jgi:hypothetical protein
MVEAAYHVELLVLGVLGAQEHATESTRKHDDE